MPSGLYARLGHTSLVDLLLLLCNRNASWLHRVARSTWKTQHLWNSFLILLWLVKLY